MEYENERFKRSTPNNAQQWKAKSGTVNYTSDDFKHSRPVERINPTARRNWFLYIIRTSYVNLMVRISNSMVRLVSS